MSSQTGKRRRPDDRNVGSAKIKRRCSFMQQPQKFRSSSAIVRQSKNRSRLELYLSGRRDRRSRQASRRRRSPPSTAETVAISAGLPPVGARTHKRAHEGPQEGHDRAVVREGPTRARSLRPMICTPGAPRPRQGILKRKTGNGPHAPSIPPTPGRGKWGRGTGTAVTCLLRCAFHL
jgi:hypothetical protein